MVGLGGGSYGGAAAAAPSDPTLVEVACRLVTTRNVQSTGVRNLSLLVYPDVRIDLQHVDAALAHLLPSAAVAADGQATHHHQHQQQQQQQQAGQASGWHQVALMLTAGGRSILGRLPGMWQVLHHEAPPHQLLAWNCCQPLLAVGHGSSGAVLVYDAGTAAAAGNSSGSGSGEPMTQPRQVLIHQLQQQVCSLAWRPVNSSTLAVGCSGGVGLWNLGKLPLSAAATAGGHTTPGWVTFLDFKPGCCVTSLSWSPDGGRIAGASADTNRLMVWDAALGVGTKLRLGLAPAHLLLWSPDGSYLFAADLSGAFHLLETSAWSSKRWESPPGSAVTGAAWAPDSSVLLLSLSGSAALVALHIVGTAPDLAEQMLPVTLPGVSDAELAAPVPRQQQQQQQPSAAAGCISGLAWDPTGARLAVTLGAPHPAAGCVALFATGFSPVVSAHFIGYVQPGAAAAAASKAADGPPCEDTGDGDGGTQRQQQQQRRLQVAFAPVSGKDKAAGLLSVGLARGQGGDLALVRNVPLFY